MFTIVGSGFGLYGYLPALVESFGEPVVLPEKYRSKVKARPELEPYLSAIEWVSDPETALARASGVVVATPPRRQAEVVSQLHRYPELKTLVLEKPVAVTPSMAIDLLCQLRRSGKRFRIGYTFLHAGWASRLEWPDTARSGEVVITWAFMAHHFSHALANWKREHSEGGGVLRFFGVHLLALLAHHGYRDVDRSVLDGECVAQPERWQAVFSGPQVPDCRVSVDSRSDTTQFKVALAGSDRSLLLVNLSDPYQLEESAVTHGHDPRVEVLKRLLDTIQSDDLPYYELYDEVNLLWQRVEAASTFATN